nr:MAG TPA: hypothetical protein [Caudoviricetes sp.]
MQNQSNRGKTKLLSVKSSIITQKKRVKTCVLRKFVVSLYCQ